MISRRPLNRRTFVRSAGAVLAWPVLVAPPMAGALAQQVGQPAPAAISVWRELGAIATEADRLGLSVPRMSAGVEVGVEFDRLMPAIVDIIESIEASAAASTAPKADVERLLERSSDLLRRLQQAERSPPTDRDPSGAAVPTARPSFESLREGYVQLFDSCAIRDEQRSQVTWHVGKLTEAGNREQYAKVAEEVCAPWYFIGIIHALEASFNFRAHLHNGDPLGAKTVQVPKGRPPVWSPPSDWISSANDAINYDGFADQQDWSLPRTLYRWEAYNGFRSRLLHSINTPYLWSFSNHYSKGKFVADNVWDSNAVSKQCGAAVLLKMLVERGAIALPT